MLLPALAAAAAAAAARSHVCVNKFTTPTELAALRWDAVTDLGQSINPLVVAGNGSVAPADAATWPRADLVGAAHGNATRIFAAVRPASKEGAAAFLASPLAALDAAAEAVAAAAIPAGYDGIQLDFEGLSPESRPGLEAFVAACGAAARRRAPAAYVSVTVYGPKLVLADWSAYNVSALARKADVVFIMGYDMTWKDAKPGGLLAGPNSPLDSLALALDNAARAGAPAAALVLGLPFYGRVFACDGAAPPAVGNCSCAEKNFKKKSIDIIAALPGPGCARGYDVPTATPWWDCPNGTAATGLPAGVRQQGWYEDPRSVRAKLALAAGRGLAGVGVWSASGCSGTTPDGTEIWAALAGYVSGGAA